MAAAIAASAIVAFGFEASAQTTGGGIGANVNSNAGAGGLPTQGTTGAAGGTTTSGVAAPNAPSSPVRVGSGPGINNTGSPVLSTPRNLQSPIGGTPGRTPGGTAKIPGNTVPVPPVNTTRGLNGANVPQPTTATEGTTATGAPRALTPTTIPNTGAVNRRPGTTMRSGVITNFTDTSISFQEGASTNKFVINSDTVVQMDGRNITMRDIPANAQVRIERNPRFSNVVQRIVVVPPTASTTGGTSVNTQTGTGSTGSANRSLQDRADIGDFGGATNRTGAQNTPAPSGDINAATSNATSGDINAPTANATSGDINAPVVNNANTSNRPLAPGSTNPADQPVSPFTRGPEQRIQAGFDENTQNRTQTQTQPTIDSSQFLGPVSGSNQKRSSPGTDTSATTETGTVGAVPLPAEATSPTDRNPADGVRKEPRHQLWTGALGSRLGMQMSDTQQGLTVGNIANQSLAARSGLMAGDRIQSINGTNVTTAADFGRALQAANVNQGPISASVLRNDRLENVNLTLPNGFFNGINIPPVTNVAGATTLGNAPSAAVLSDGTPAVNVNGVTIPANEGTQVGAAATATTATPGTQTTTTQESTVVQGQAPGRVRPVDPPVGTQRQAVTTEALKIPDINLGWTLKANPEGVVMSSLVEDGLAAKNKFQTGDIIESIDERPITSPGAVSYELHRHRAGATVKFGILRNGQRITEDVTLPQSHKPLLLNRNETFGQANNSAKDQGGSGARPVPVKPTEESIRTLEAENRALRRELEELRQKK